MREKQTENRLRFSDVEGRTNWSNKHLGIQKGMETENGGQYFVKGTLLSSDTENKM